MHVFLFVFDCNIVVVGLRAERIIGVDVGFGEESCCRDWVIAVEWCTDRLTERGKLAHICSLLCVATD